MSVRTVCSCSSSEWSWQHFQLSLTNSGLFLSYHRMCDEHAVITSIYGPADVQTSQCSSIPARNACLIVLFSSFSCTFVSQISHHPERAFLKLCYIFIFMVCGVTQSVYLALFISKILCCSFVDRLLLKLHGSIFCVATTIVHVCDVSADAADVGWR